VAAVAALPPAATSIGPAVGMGLFCCGAGRGGTCPGVELALAVLGAWEVGCGPAAQCGSL